MKLPFIYIIMLCATISVNAQVFNFDIGDGNGHTNYVGVGASGTIDFSSGTTVDIIIDNDGSVPSFVTQFYILKPMGIEATNLASYTDELNKSWNLATIGEGSVLNEFSPNLDLERYFGANIPNGPTTNGLPESSTHMFSFSFNTLSLGFLDWSFYTDQSQSVPHIFIRWQEVNDGDSAKGYDIWGYDIPPPVVVPEPSLIGLLGIMGLSLMLYIRNRFRK